jgi:hypothetical protein
LLGPRGQVARGVVDLDINGEPPLAQSMEQGDQAWRQSILGIFKDGRQATRKERPAERDHDAVLEQQRAHLIHDGGALDDEAPAYAVHGL